MNWFDTSGLTSLAKSALKEAQKTIDKALDIQDDSGDEQESEQKGESTSNTPSGSNETPPKESSDFFASWGLTTSAESAKDEPIKEQPVVTESPSKSTPQSMWGSFAGSFFEQPKSSDGTIVHPPKAKSMNIISDSKYDSQDDLFSKSQLVMSESEGLEYKNVKTNSPKQDEHNRRGSSRSNILSLVSSRNSSDSVEVLSQSMKTTPDSEVSAQSMSHSSSVGQKLNSESVEILPDSLVSPSSIECLGFDSYCSEKNSSSSSILSPDISDKKSTPVGDRTERAETADSVSLVADDDDDTVSYNSVSECTAPTVLDTEDKSISPFPKTIRSEPRKIIDKEFIHIEQALAPQKMQMSENSSNDGSWSDRTLNADNDSVNLDVTLEEKKETEHEDVLMEKLSDSSSFYDVNVSSEMVRSASSAFVNVEKRQCATTESCNSSQKDGSVKERISPVSSESKSDLVKIGSDRTSGHTSGDELETTTSSDIEIIPSPNGDNGHGFCRNSPAKYAFKGKFDGTTSPNLVDLVLGKSLATKIRGHNRELSEVSIQSNTSDDSQGSENDRLMRRLCEMAEILEARENRLMEVSRSNAELVENNADLKSQVESLLAKHEMVDIHMITEDYTERLSALEKKFQQAIREKDLLRKQLDTMKSDSLSRKNSSELENMLKEKDEVIAQMQEEGEKLSGQQLHHTNIIKKLRNKDKDNEQVVKGLRDKIAELTSELDRVKRSMAAKEELEVNQIEAVYRLTTANKKMETELIETKSALDDTTQRLDSTKTTLDVVRKELTDLQRSSAELTRRRADVGRLETDKAAAEDEAHRLRAEVRQLRQDMMQEEKRWISRETALRKELESSRAVCASLEAGAGADAGAGAEAAAALLAQLAALQRAALERDQAHQNTTRALAEKLDDAETALVKAVERERLAREETSQVQEALTVAESLLNETRQRLTAAGGQLQDCLERGDKLTSAVASKTEELERLKGESEREISQLKARVSETERLLQAERDALEKERKRSVIMQEQASARGDISPTHSLSSDSFSTSFWPEECPSAPLPVVSAMGVESLVSRLQAREGEARAAAAALTRMRAQRDHHATLLAQTRAELDDARSVQEQYDALLQMYGEKEEQLAELKLDLQDVTQLYKAQLDELIALRQQVGR